MALDLVHVQDPMGAGGVAAAEREAAKVRLHLARGDPPPDAATSTTTTTTKTTVVPHHGMLTSTATSTARSDALRMLFRALLAPRPLPPRSRPASSRRRSLAAAASASPSPLVALAGEASRHAPVEAAIARASSPASSLLTSTAFPLSELLHLARYTAALGPTYVLNILRAEFAQAVSTAAASSSDSEGVVRRLVGALWLVPCSEEAEWNELARLREAWLLRMTTTGLQAGGSVVERAEREVRCLGVIVEEGLVAKGIESGRERDGGKGEGGDLGGDGVGEVGMTTLPEEEEVIM